MRLKLVIQEMEDIVRWLSSSMAGTGKVKSFFTYNGSAARWLPLCYKPLFQFIELADEIDFTISGSGKVEP